MTDQTIAHDLAQGIGALAWWDLLDSKISPAELRGILGFEKWDIKVPDIKPQQAIRKGANSWRKGAGNAERFKADVVFSDSDTMIVGILKRVRIGPKKVAWEQVDRIVYSDMQGGTPIRIEQGNTIEADEVHECISWRFQYLNHEWIRPNLIKAPLAQLGAFNLRRSGGIVFVPAQGMDELDRIARVVRQLGKSQFHVSHVADTGDSRDSIGASAQGSLVGKLKDIKQRLDGWESATKRTSSKISDRTFAEFRELRDQARLYADCLNIQLDSLLGSIGSAEDRARFILDGQGPKPTNGGSSARTPSEKLKSKIEDLREQYGDEVTGAQLAEAGWSKTAITKPAYWNTDNYSPRATLREMGLQATLIARKGETSILRFAQLELAEPQDSNPEDSANEPSGAPDLQVYAKSVKAMSAADLRDEFQRLTGDEPRNFGKGYSRKDLEADVLAAAMVEPEKACAAA